MGDENLKDTLRQTTEETQATSASQKGETKKESSQKAETSSGETAKEYVSGIDISDVPVEMRPQLREKLTEKASLLEKGYQGKFKALETFARVILKELNQRQD